MRRRDARLGALHRRTLWPAQRPQHPPQAARGPSDDLTAVLADESDPLDIAIALRHVEHDDPVNEVWMHVHDDSLVDSW
ncbi:hypothetical protein ACWIBQ_04965 [Microbacterium keratanolyticum]